MVRQILFLPDSELVVPGRSGAGGDLGPLARLCAQQLREALNETQAESVLVFASATSRFERPLPGFAIARQLLATANYGGEVLTAQPGAQPSVEAISRAALWLILGTGAASHGPEAPLVADGAGAEIDARVQRALGGGDAQKFTQISIDQARAVGATLVEPATAAAHALGQAPAAKWTAGELDRHKEFGVTYFLMRWYRRGERG